MALPTLIYFPARGRAELIRLVLAEAGVDYQEHPVGMGSPPESGRPTDFAELKASGILAFGAVPVWEDADGFRLAQSLAIANYLGGMAGLRGKNDKEAALIDQALGGVEDARMEVRKLIGAAPEQRAAVREEVSNVIVPRWLGYFQRLLESNHAQGGFLVGDSLSVADLALWYLLELIQDNGLGARMADYPVIGGFFERIAMRPRIAAYLTSPKRPALMLLPV